MQGFIKQYSGSKNEKSVKIKFYNLNKNKFYQKMDYLKILISALFQNNVLRYYFNTNYLWNTFFDWSNQLFSVISLLSYH